VQSCAALCAGFPTPPIDRWDPDVSACLSAAATTQGLPYEPFVCSPLHPAFRANLMKKCPDDLPKDDRWLYDACLALSPTGALEKASTAMPSPVKEFAKLAGKGGKAACCDAALNTQMPPIWQCTMKEMAAKKPTFKACKSCCDDKWPILGTTNVELNGACTKSCTRGQGAYTWPDS
jgi:hypothetical protein